MENKLKYLQGWQKQEKKDKWNQFRDGRTQISFRQFSTESVFFQHLPTMHFDFAYQKLVLYFFFKELRTAC